MRVSRLDENKDWTFGRGKANYAIEDEAIAQNVSTRVKSFANDWFLDTVANIDWIAILGLKTNRDIILNEVERVISETVNVIRITEIDFVENRQERFLTISAAIITIFDNRIFTTIEI